MNRRDFIIATGAGTVAATAAVGVASAATPEWLAGGSGAAKLSRAQFEAWLNTEFRVQPVGQRRSKSATLVAVHPGREAPGLEQFHAEFRTEAPLEGAGLCHVRRDDGTAMLLAFEPGPKSDPNVARVTFSLLAG